MMRRGTGAEENEVGKEGQKGRRIMTGEWVRRGMDGRTKERVKSREQKERENDYWFERQGLVTENGTARERRVRHGRESKTKVKGRGTRRKGRELTGLRDKGWTRDKEATATQGRKDQGIEDGEASEVRMSGQEP